MLRSNRRLSHRALLASTCLVVAAAGCGTSATTAKPTATSSTTATPSSTGPTTATAPYAWSIDPSTALQVGGGPASTLASVLAPAGGSGTWQIAGTRSNADGSTTATVWASTDALTWTSTALTAPGTDSVARAATTWGGRTLVVGSTGTGTGQRAAVWLSPGAGQPFQQISGDGAFGAPAPASGPGGGAEMDVVGAGGLGAFAAGQVAGTPAVWYSTDGRHWTQLKGAEQVMADADRAEVHAITVGANGVFAAGSVEDGGATDGAVWASTDGITWRAEQAPMAFTGDGDHTISSLVSLGTGFVAAGAVRTGQTWAPASWISPNGYSWSQASLAFPMSSGARPDVTGTEVHGLASTTMSPASATTATGTLAAVGGSTTEQRLWTSTDGTTWRSTPFPAAAEDAAGWQASRVATDGTTTIVVDDTAGVPRVLVDRPQGWAEVTADPAWFGAPRATATPVKLLTVGTSIVLVARLDEPGQSLGTGTETAAVYTSADGTTWAPAQTSAFAGDDVTDAAQVTGGLVAVGSAAPLSSTLAAGPVGARAWTSPDGRTWTATTGDGASGTGVFGGGAQGEEKATGVTRLGSTIVAIGASAGGSTGPADQGVAWTSTDGATWSAPAPLDPQPSLAIERPAGVCAGPQTVAAVGSAVVAGPGSQAVAWSSSDGVHWQPASITPTPESSADEAMTSCITAGNGFIGLGDSQGPQGTDDPAIWYSSDSASQWTRQTVSAFTGSGLGPITDLAVAGTTWLAVSGTGGATTLPGGGLGLWRSTDAGATWQRLPTSGGPWATPEDAGIDQVLLDGSGALVAGSVGGRLTVWVGTASAGTSTPGSTGTSGGAPSTSKAATDPRSQLPQAAAPTSKAAHIRA